MLKRLTVALSIMVMTILTLPLPTTKGRIAQAQEKTATDGSNLVGNWTGESICVGNRPACHDEHVVYRIVKTPDKQNTFTITMDKIVDGKPETMAVLDFNYDAAKGALENEFTRGNTHGLWQFTVTGNLMEGTLIILPAKTVGRRVKVKKRRLTTNLTTADSNQPPQPPPHQPTSTPHKP